MMSQNSKKILLLKWAAVKLQTLQATLKLKIKISFACYMVMMMIFI